MAKGFRKIKTVSQLNIVINAVERHVPLNSHERMVKKIYLFILEMHADRPWLFSKQTVDNYSEADYQYKFWSYVLETYLGSKCNVVLRWGDTMSNSSKKTGNKFKLDLRLVVLPNDETALDGCTGEMAKKASAKKVFTDKLKSTVVTKCHLNDFIKEVPFVRHQDIHLIKMPIIQIAGFDGRLTVLSLNKKKEYQLEEVSSFCFPKSLCQIQNGGLEKLIDVLATIEDLMHNFQKVHQDSCEFGQQPGQCHRWKT